MFGTRRRWPRLPAPLATLGVAALVVLTLDHTTVRAGVGGGTGSGLGAAVAVPAGTAMAPLPLAPRGAGPEEPPVAAAEDRPVDPNSPEELHCVFEVTRETLPTVFAGAGPGQVARVPRPRNEPPRREVFRLTVGLTKDTLVCEDPGGTPEVVAYHFPSRRITELDLAKKTYRDLSLYAVVAFRVNESINRFAFAASFARGPGQPRENLADPAKAAQEKAADRDPAPPDPELVRCIDRFAVETLYSLRLKNAPAHPPGVAYLEKPVIKAVARPFGPGWEFVHDERTAVEFVPSDRPVPPAYLRSLRHFLAYRCAIHPEIRETILGTGKLPEVLSYRSVEFFGRTDQTVTLKLASATLRKGGWSGVPGGFTPSYDPDDPLDVVTHKLDLPGHGLAAANHGVAVAEAVAGVVAAEPLPSDREALRRMVESSLKAGRFFDAYLGWCEYASRTGDPALEIGNLISGARYAPLDLIAAGLPPTREAAEQRLAHLEAVDRKGLKFGYMLDVLSGSTLNTLGRAIEAEGRWLDALKVNPRLTSVLVQLGSNRFRGFATTDAWRCFDAARKIDPKSPLLAEITQLEANLVRDFPDEF